MEMSIRKHGHIGVLCTLFGLGFGAIFGASDQTVYMLSGLRMADPSLWQNDWLVSSTTHPHFAFNHLIFILAKLGNVEWSATAAHVATMLVVGVSLYSLMTTLYSRPLLPFLFSIVLLHLVIGKVVLSHGFFLPLLLPTNVAAALFLAGIATLSHAVKHETTPRISATTNSQNTKVHSIRLFGFSGLLFGLSGFVHATFLVLVPVFLIGVLLYRPLSVRAAIGFGVPYLMLSLPAVCWAIQGFVIDDAGSLERLDEFARMRIPHHYLPTTWGMEPFLQFAGYLVLGAIGLSLRKAVANSIVMASVASIGCMSVVIFFCTVVFFLPHVAMLQAYRFVSLLSVLSIVFFSGALAGQVESASGSFTRRDLLRSLALLFGLVYVYWIDGLVGAALTVLFLSGWIGMKLTNFARFSSRTAMVVCTSVVLLTQFGHAVHRFPMSTRALMPLPEGLASLFEWVRETTSKDALFVVPIDLQRFRLHTRRSIVVDWKGNAFRRKDIEEWFRRLGAVCGVSNARSYRELYRGYLALDGKRARQLADEFGAEYLVVKAFEHKGHLDDLEKVYSQFGFSIYRIANRSPIPLETAT